MADKPNDFVLIIGAMKSGTTSLFSYLAEHPEIAACRIKEPNFFGEDENWAKGVDWYRSLWQWRRERHKVALEATSHYAKRPYVPNVPERIAEVKDATFRFIYIMRHPLDRLESHNMHIAILGTPALDEEISQNSIWASQYSMQLDAYRSFGRTRMLLLFTEDLKKDPQRVLQTACRFMGVDPDYKFMSFHKQYNTRSRYSDVLPGFWASLNRIGFLKKMVQRLPRATRARLRSRLARRVELDESKYQLSPAQRDSVIEKLRPDLHRLHSEYGVDVESRWGIRLTEQ